MPSHHAYHPNRSRRIRPAGAGVSGGASSLLRLSTATSPRWPSAESVAEWIDSAAMNLDGPVTAPMVAPAADAASEIFTRLRPSPVLGSGAMR